MLGLNGAFIEKEDLTGDRLFAKVEDIAKDYTGYCKIMSEKVEQAFLQAQRTPSLFAKLLTPSADTRCGCSQDIICAHEQILD